MKSYPVVCSTHPVTARHNSEQQLLYLIHISKLLRFKKKPGIYGIYLYIYRQKEKNERYIHTHKQNVTYFVKNTLLCMAYAGTIFHSALITEDH